MLNKTSERLKQLKEIEQAELLIHGIARKAKTGYFTRQEELDAKEIQAIIAIKNSLGASMITPMPMFDEYNIGGRIVATPVTARAYIAISQNAKELKTQYKHKYGHDCKLVG